MITEISIEVEDAEVACMRCGRTAMKLIYSVHRMREVGFSGGRLRVNGWAPPPDWQRFAFLLLDGFLCPSCAATVAPAIIKAVGPLQSPPR